MPEVGKMKFNIYQARNGGVYISSGSLSTELSRKQIDDLRIDVYSLDDFDYECFKKHYED